MSHLEIRHDAIRRGRSTILEAAAISAPLPAVVGVVGINGSGKSSLFMHLGGNLLHRGPATVRVGQRTPTIASLPQVPALPGWMNAVGVARLYGCDFQRLAADMPGLYLHELADRRVRRLSVGQRQALAAALTLHRRADLTLLDEPFAALDFRRRIGLLELIERRRAEDDACAIMVSSQSASDLTGICNHYMVIRDGRYWFSGSPEELAGVNEPDAIERSLLRALTDAPPGSARFETRRIRPW